MTDFSIPLISLPYVFHIGTLDKRMLGKNSGKLSLEGHSLSVSRCPHAWRYIAKLGGNSLFKMDKPDGMFVDVHGIVDAGHLPAVLDWARAEKLVKDANLWKSWQFDLEAEEWRFQYTDDEEFAIEEAAEDGYGPDGIPAVEEVTVPVGTWKLESSTGIRVRNDEDATDTVLLAFALKQDADGAWWREEFDPDKLSAPRGAIFPDKVSSWSATKIGWGEVDDEEELARFEEISSSVATPR